MKYGWMWKIPTQGRYGCGYVFDSNCVSDENIKLEIENYTGEKIINPKLFNFNAGCYEKTWINNCVAIGLSAGFTEPLEATSIWVSISSLKFFKNKIDEAIFKKQNYIEEYNNAIKNMNDDICIFLHLHYLCKRKDTIFWKKFYETKIENYPDLLKNIKLNLLQISEKNNIDYIPTFNSKSWDAVITGIKFKE